MKRKIKTDLTRCQNQLKQDAKWGWWLFVFLFGVMTVSLFFNYFQSLDICMLQARIKSLTTIEKRIFHNMQDRIGEYEDALETADENAIHTERLLLSMQQDMQDWTKFLNTLKDADLIKAVTAPKNDRDVQGKFRTSYDINRKLINKAKALKLSQNNEDETDNPALDTDDEDSISELLVQYEKH